MNIHPLVVHFPIALLTVYSGAEILRLGFIRRHAAWFHIKAFLLIAGTIGAYFATLTGEIAAEVFGSEEIVEVHEQLANLTMFAYGILALSYLIQWLDRSGFLASNGAWRRLANLERTIFRAPVQILLAIAGFILLTMTGAMGGALVYGPEMDPVVSFVYHLFFAK